MENNTDNTNEEYITITVDNGNNSNENTSKKNNKKSNGKRTARIGKKEKKPRKKWSKKKKIIVITSIILVIFLTLGIIFGTYIYKANGDITEAVLNVATDVLGNDDPVFVLVLGVSEDIKTALTDTIILCGYNPETQQSFMLSIPRDTFVGKSEASASGYDKINALYQKDVTRTVEAVEKLTGINIDYWVVVRNTVLPDIVKAIGEVEFDVPIDMDYDDPTQNLHIHLDAGVQMIDGDKAEQLLRFRHNNDGSSYPSSYGDNDYGRMRTQREFMKAVASQLVNSGSTSNLKAIAEAVFHNLQTDMPFTTIAGYLPYALKFNVENIRMEQLPGASAMINELWFYKSSSSETKELMDELIAQLGLDEKEIKNCYQYTVTKTSGSTTTTTKKNETNTAKDNTSEEKTSTKTNTTSTTTSENINQTSTTTKKEDDKTTTQTENKVVEKPSTTNKNENKVVEDNKTENNVSTPTVDNNNNTTNTPSTNQTPTPSVPDSGENTPSPESPGTSNDGQQTDPPVSDSTTENTPSTDQGTESNTQTTTSE